MQWVFCPSLLLKGNIFTWEWREMGSYCLGCSGQIIALLSKNPYSNSNSSKNSNSYSFDNRLVIPREDESFAVATHEVYFLLSFYLNLLNNHFFTKTISCGDDELFDRRIVYQQKFRNCSTAGKLLFVWLIGHATILEKIAKCAVWFEN